MKQNFKNGIDFQDSRIELGLEKIDIYELLDESGIEYSEEGRNISSGYIGISPCFECGDTRFHAAIQKDEYFTTCFICKCHVSPLKTIAHLKKTNVYNAAKYLIDLADDEEDLEQRIRNVLKPLKRKEVESFRGIDTLPDNKLITKQIIKQNKALHQFLINRKIKSWDVEKYDLRIGINAAKGKIIFPIYLDERIVSYQTRRIDRKEYFIAPNLSKYLLWEDLIDSKPLLLVEGYLDAIHLKSFTDIYYKDKFSITTGFTKSLSSEQIQIIIEKNPKKVICIFDSRAWTDYKKYKNLFPVDTEFVILPEVNGKESDPNSLTFGMLLTIFREQIL